MRLHEPYVVEKSGQKNPIYILSHITTTIFAVQMRSFYFSYFSSLSIYQWVIIVIYFINSLMIFCSHVQEEKVVFIYLHFYFFFKLKIK